MSLATRITSARGVRLSAGNPGPARRASTIDEKKGKSGSIQSAVVVWIAPRRAGVSFWFDPARSVLRTNIATAAAAECDLIAGRQCKRTLSEFRTKDCELPAQHAEPASSATEHADVRTLLVEAGPFEELNPFAGRAHA